MKKNKVYFVVIIAVLFATASSGLAAVVSPLDGVSVQSTFGLGTGNHEAAPARWMLVSGGNASNFISSYGDANPPTNNAALCINWPPSYGNYTYAAQFTTSTPALANQSYKLSILAGSLVNWESGNANYRVYFGAVSGEVFTEFAVSAAHTIAITSVDFLCNSQGQSLTFTGTSGSSISGNIAIRIEVTAGDHLYWPAFDNVRLETIEADFPMITAQPVSQNIEPGETAVFTVAGLSIVSYQWYKNSTALTNGGNISGATTNTLTISNVQIADEAGYFCRVYGASSSVDSGKASLLVSRSLVAHWSFDGNLNDSSGFDNDGTAVGSISYATGVDNMPDSALYLENIGDAQNYVRISDPVYSLNIPDADMIAYTGSLTLSFWVKPSFIQSYEMYASTGILPNGGWYAARYGNSYMATFLVNPSQADFVTKVLNDGQWHLYTAVMDTSSGILKLYMDGQVQAQKPAAPTPGVDFLIGALNWKANRTAADNISLGYTGLLDDIRVYNYALSDEEIAQLFHTVVDNAVCVEIVTGDINEDCQVDIIDIDVIAKNWLHESACTEPLSGDINGDCRVDFCDFIIISDNWLNCTLMPGVACEE